MLHRMVIKSLWTFFVIKLDTFRRNLHLAMLGFETKFFFSSRHNSILKDTIQIASYNFQLTPAGDLSSQESTFPWIPCQNVVWLIPVLGETMLTKPFDIFWSLGWNLILNWQALQLSAWPKTWQTSFVNRIHGQDGKRCLRPLLEPLFTSER